MFKYSNAFQAVMKNNVDTSKKALGNTLGNTSKKALKMDVLKSKLDIELDTNIQLFDVITKPISVHGCEMWGHENIEEIEVFHRNFL